MYVNVTVMNVHRAQVSHIYIYEYKLFVSDVTQQYEYIMFVCIYYVYCIFVYMHIYACVCVYI